MSGELHLVRLEPAMARVHAWWRSEALTPRDGADDGYAWHALLAAAFGPLAPKPFRVVARRGKPVHLLGYGAADAAALQARAGDFADPAVLAALPLDAIAGKPMPAFEPRRRLSFEIQLRPTVRTDRGGDRTRSAERDVYALARDRALAGGEEPPDKGEVFLAWARERLAADPSFKVGSLRVAGFEGVDVVRRDRSRHLRPVPGHRVMLTGDLMVVDPAAFRSTLARGLGRHRAFGFGMMLLSPATSEEP